MPKARQRLFTPGPTPVPQDVMDAIARPVIHHRHEEFAEIFRRISENLSYVFQTREPVYTLTSSGTGAMETAVCNLLSPADEVLYVNAGKFGARWGEICRSYGVKAEEITCEWGQAADPASIGRALGTMGRPGRTKAVFLTHCETSTGVAHDIREITRVVRSSSEALVVVDGITSVGALELRMDEWGIDVVLTASQKGLMVPPGLSFIGLSGRAWNSVVSSTLPRYYFDLRAAKEALSRFNTPWTPATSLVVGLDVALSMMKREGMEDLWKRHARLAAAMRGGCEALGLKLFPSVSSNALTVVSPPAGVDPARLIRTLKADHAVVVAGGQGPLKGKIMRIAHLGYFNDSDITGFMSSLEESLRHVGGTFKAGAGVNAARRLLESA